MGGRAAVQDFWKLYLVPAQGHGGPNGTTSPAANPPIVAAGQMYALLRAWVEEGTAPDAVVLQTPESAATQKSRPICVYPKKATYGSGDPSVAAAESQGGNVRLQPSEFVCAESLLRHASLPRQAASELRFAQTNVGMPAAVHSEETPPMKPAVAARRLAAALACASAIPLATAAEIQLTISDLKFELLDMTPGDGVDPWITGLTPGSPWPTYVDRAASYTGYPNQRTSPVHTEWNFELGPNSALSWSFNYEFVTTIYEGYGQLEWVESFLGAGSTALGNNNYQRDIFVLEISDDQATEQRRLTTIESGTLGTTVLGLPDMTNPGSLSILIGALDVQQGLAVEPLSPIPEPSTWAFMLAGVAALIGRRRLMKDRG